MQQRWRALLTRGRARAWRRARLLVGCPSMTSRVQSVWRRCTSHASTTAGAPSKAMHRSLIIFARCACAVHAHVHGERALTMFGVPRHAFCFWCFHRAMVRAECAVLLENRCSVSSLTHSTNTLLTKCYRLLLRWWAPGLEHVALPAVPSRVQALRRCLRPALRARLQQISGGRGGAGRGDKEAGS